MLTTLFQLNIRYWTIFTAILTIIVSCLSLYPLLQLPDVPGKDKTLHLIAYAVFSLPCALAHPKKLWILVPLLIVTWSGLLELIQPYVNRYAEWMDLLANSVGVLIGNFVGLLLRRWLV